MTLTELAELVKQMRTAQKAYFKTDYTSAYKEKQEWLAKSKVLEKEVDKALKEILEPNPQKGLF